MNDFDHPEEGFLFGKDRDDWFIPELSRAFLARETGDFTNLEAWKNAMDFVMRVYRLTASFPERELSGLALDMRRRAVSVPSTIASGYGQGSRQDISRCLDDACMVLTELQTLIELGRQLGYVSEFEAELSVEHAFQVKRQVNGLKQSILAELN